MYCIVCRSKYNWKTGKLILSGVFHNPELTDERRRNGQLRRDFRDFPCGGIPSKDDILDKTNLGTRRHF